MKMMILAFVTAIAFIGCGSDGGSGGVNNTVVYNLDGLLTQNYAFNVKYELRDNSTGDIVDSMNEYVQQTYMGSEFYDGYWMEKVTVNGMDQYYLGGIPYQWQSISNQESCTFNGYQGELPSQAQVNDVNAQLNYYCPTANTSVIVNVRMEAIDTNNAYLIAYDNDSIFKYKVDAYSNLVGIYTEVDNPMPFIPIDHTVISKAGDY